MFGHSYSRSARQPLRVAASRSSAALDSKGVPLKANPRMWDSTFVATLKAGNLLIFQRQGPNIIPLYVQKASVYIPPRLGLSDAIRTGLGTTCTAKDRWPYIKPQ
jgi:hypothetical protein